MKHITVLLIILALCPVLSRAQGYYKVVERSGEYYYIEKPGETLDSMNRRTPGIRLGIPKGLKSVKISGSRILLYRNNQYIQVSIKMVNDSFSAQNTMFKSFEVSNLRYDRAEQLSNYPMKRGSNWRYYLCQGDYADILVVVRKFNVFAFLSPICGERNARLFASDALTKDEWDPIETDYRMLDGHPQKRYSPKYIVHQ